MPLGRLTFHFPRKNALWVNLRLLYGGVLSLGRKGGVLTTGSLPEPSAQKVASTSPTGRHPYRGDTSLREKHNLVGAHHKLPGSRAYTGEQTARTHV